MALPSLKEHERRLKAQQERRIREQKKLRENIERLAAYADSEKTWRAGQEAMIQAMQEAIIELGRIVKEQGALLRQVKEQQTDKGRIINSTAYEFVDIGRDENGDISSARVIPVLKH